MAQHGSTPGTRETQKSWETRSPSGPEHPEGTLRDFLPIFGHTIQYNEEQRIFVIDHNRIISCTPSEYRAFALLCEQAGQCVSYLSLFTHIQGEKGSQPGTPKQARSRTMYLVSDLRAKIWPCGLDIVAVMGTGYILLAKQDE